MKILLFDNYDSFTYNLRHILLQLGADVEVFHNDKISLEEVGRFDKILLSPGPGIPSEAGIMLPLIKRYATEKSILGVCLGEQAIGEAFGAKICNLTQVYHGVSTTIKVMSDDPLFMGLGTEFTAGRYHSWIVSGENFPACLEVTATDSGEGLIMGLRHRQYDVRGIQFHPESLLTPCGVTMIENWLSI
ncbi:MAG: aminodeoxychorismate/anthranilate synthase component II [Bacteroidales bacterium]